MPRKSKLFKQLFKDCPSMPAVLSVDRNDIRRAEPHGGKMPAGKNRERKKKELSEGLRPEVFQRRLCAFDKIQVIQVFPK